MPLALNRSFRVDRLAATDDTHIVLKKCTIELCHRRANAPSHSPNNQRTNEKQMQKPFEKKNYEFSHSVSIRRMDAVFVAIQMQIISSANEKFITRRLFANKITAEVKTLNCRWQRAR